jgi:hypothetical protein
MAVRVWVLSLVLTQRRLAPSVARLPGWLVVLGEVLCGLFAPRPGLPLKEAPHLVPHFGGAPANVAVQAARLGARVELIGAVGDDPMGAAMLVRLAREGVLTGHVLRLPGKLRPRMFQSQASMLELALGTVQSADVVIAGARATTQLGASSGMPRRLPGRLAPSSPCARSSAIG